MKNSDIKEADRKLKKAARKGIKKLSEEQLIQIMLLNALKEELEKLKILGNNADVGKTEKKLEFYEGLIDRKYWNDYALFYIVTALACRVVDTVEEACQMYDEFKSMKK